MKTIRPYILLVLLFVLPGVARAGAQLRKLRLESRPPK